MLQPFLNFDLDLKTHVLTRKAQRAHNCLSLFTRKGEFTRGPRLIERFKAFVYKASDSSAQWRLNARAYLGFSPGPRPIRGILKNLYKKKKKDDKRRYSRCHYSALQRHLLEEVEGGPPPLPPYLNKINVIAQTKINLNLNVLSTLF